MKTRLAAVIVLSWLVVPPMAAAQEPITVDVTATIADVSRTPVGINLNYLLDDDANRANALQRVADALKSAGVRYLRYPGGEKSDGYLWSVPPYTGSVPTLARWATGEYPDNQEWPSYDRALVEPDGHTFKTTPLGFDEFMAICREIDCVPTIVVCYDSMYKPAQAGGVAPTRDQLLETAREWVRYANVTKKYGVKYWEIGNETWQPHYNGSATASNYARDLIDFSRVMKGEDPTIFIGANGEADSWWQTVLSTAAGAIDFLAIHDYPAYNWGSYTYYQTHNVNLMSPVQVALHAIQAYAPAADRDRLVVASTEINSADWTGGWPHRNDMGHALVVFDTFGAHLVNPRVAFTEIWTTRWSGNDTATVPVLWDALDKENELQATGRATAIWGQFLREKMVSSSSTSMVRSYTTYSPSTGKLTVFLINKDTAFRSATVTANTRSAYYAVDTWVFSGDGADDLYPTWVHQGQATNAGNQFAVALPPVSVTVLDVAPLSPVYDVPGIVQAEDFADGGCWDSTDGNRGGRYRATDVDIEATSDSGAGFDVGWTAAGEWLEFPIRVQASGFYDLSARVASPYTGTSLRLSIDGQDVSGELAIPGTGGWQAWRTVTQTGVYLAAGPHRATVATATGSFNINWISFAASTVTAHAVPGTIEAEDFRDGGYWDSTRGNTGGVYRSTDVDLQGTNDSGGGVNVGWVAAGEWLEYDLRVAVPGYYDLSARVASPYSGKSLRVLLDGTDVSGSLAVPNTGAWQNWKTIRRPAIYLAAGTHRARVAAITDGFNLNWLSFALPFAGAHTVPGTIEAEDFEEGAYWDSTAGNTGTAYRATDVDIEVTSDSAGAFNVGWIAAGEWQEYPIQVGATADYDLSVRVASPYTGKTFRVFVDGIDVTGTLSVPNTGGYQRWQTVVRSGIRLLAGAHRVRLAAGTSGFNVNWIALH